MFLSALVLIKVPKVQVPTLNNTTNVHKIKLTAQQEITPIVPVPAVKPQAAPVTTQPVTPAATTVAPTVDLSNHDQLMSLAGISQSDWPAVDYIVSHESGWDPDATEPTTGAHGLPQALPYSKTGCGWDDAVCQLEWANQYALSRYGGWWSAYDYWITNNNW